MNLFSQRFKELRKKSKMTQSEIANILHTSPQNISRWENNESEPDINMILDISKFFEVSSDYLLGRNSDNEKIILSDIFRYIKNLPKEKQIDSVMRICNKTVNAMFDSIFNHGEEHYDYDSTCVMIDTKYGICLNSYGEIENEKRLPMFLLFSEPDLKLANEYIKSNPKYKELFETLADEDIFNAILKIYSSGYNHECGFDFQSLEKEFGLNGETFEKVLTNLTKYDFIWTREINGSTKVYYLGKNMRMMCIIYICYSVLFNRINGNIS